MCGHDWIAERTWHIAYASICPSLPDRHTNSCRVHLLILLFYQSTKTEICRCGAYYSIVIKPVTRAVTYPPGRRMMPVGSPPMHRVNWKPFTKQFSLFCHTIPVKLEVLLLNDAVQGNARPNESALRRFLQLLSLSYSPIKHPAFSHAGINWNSFEPVILLKHAVTCFVGACP